MDNNHTVYYHLNKANGKVYFGITGQGTQGRWGNGRRYINSPHLNAAINKYGWDGFHHRILIDGLSKEIAELIEQNLIRWSKSQNPNYGYNIRSGGNTSALSPETKAKISKAITGRTLSEEARRKVSVFQQSRVVTDEVKQKISIAQKWKKVPVRCIETGEVFDSITEAAKALGIDATCIRNATNGKTKTCKKFHWERAIRRNPK